jgi:hypothetical protein
MEIISTDYGIIKIDTNPSIDKTTDFTTLLRSQISKQTFKENKGRFANSMFHFGLRWGRKSGMLKPVLIHSFSGKSDFYAYDSVDQNNNPLPSLNVLQPIIDEIESHLGIDMSDYDSMIGNIYLDGEYVYPHRDTTESLSSRNYPVIVYTIGNDASLGIWDDNNGLMTFANTYDSNYAPGSLKGLNPTNEVLTKNGSIYTFGLEGHGRFELVHTTPSLNQKKVEYPKLLLPSLEVISKYTITLTFRRAKDLTSGIPNKPLNRLALLEKI